MKSKGFTLLECLLSLMILGLSVLLINGIIRQMPQVNQQLFARKDQEWQIFLIQLERELQTCTYVSVSPYTLFLKSSKENVVTIDRINGKVRKRDNNGYHPLLTEVSLIYFEKRHPRSSLQ
ncbi:competence type IV pilus minor pilin ComGF [Enterococcus gallinarum]|uniref:competence type IV pilus minor pilin ComGF n=1 Tax=Enterococcus gallinarum TaxID=1353 RepID=UPI00232B184A|nr:competence type IV pilus minor pilin ComGF [Enterococcus gallinarum]WCG07515.1 competence type IV pilus minor pilin ComGF [Enterococcus gallinarum]